MSSPTLSIKRELTPPSVSDPTLLHIHDRLNQLDSKVLDLRATVLTKDAYVDRRNWEDSFLRREFEKLSGQLDTVGGKTRTDVSKLKTDLSQLKAEIIQLRAHVEQLASKESFLHSDVTQIQSAVNQLHTDVQQLHTDVCSTRIDVSQVQAIVSQIRIDLMTLHRETSQQFDTVTKRLAAMEAHMQLAAKIRYNGLAHTIYAPISPVPKIDKDGALVWPKYFPSTVWKFWCLKKRNRRKSSLGHNWSII
jgi:chromosome segregation ATPase